jgi:hypothetical protein
MLRPSNYPGNHLYHLAYLNDTMRLFWSAPKVFLANAVYYTKLSFHLKKGLGTQFRSLTNGGAKMLWVITLLPGYALYLRDRNKK